MTWDTNKLFSVPKIYSAQDIKPAGTGGLFYDNIVYTPALRAVDAKNGRLRAIFYEGLPFRGKPTRVFAYYGAPETTKGEKIPAMVLVHGGGGTAFESWVRLWNARGYAAIAMDTCGAIPVAEGEGWSCHKHAGPPGWGELNQMEWPVEDQWTYHAVAAIILAHSLIRSFPEVDAERIGLTGISWGGYLTAIAAGVDSRFRFAAPVYGCGFLGDGSKWQSIFESGSERGLKWLKLWDPAHYLKQVSAPMLWVTGTNDFAYYMNALQKSYRATSGPYTLCVRVEMPHGHNGPGETPEEILAFADSFCRKGIPLARIEDQKEKGGRTCVTFCSKSPVASAELIYTKDVGHWPERKWRSEPAVLQNNRASALLPEGTKVYYFNLIDDRGMVVSSEHVETERK